MDIYKIDFVNIGLQESFKIGNNQENKKQRVRAVLAYYLYLLVARNEKREK